MHALRRGMTILKPRPGHGYRKTCGKTPWFFPDTDWENRTAEPLTGATKNAPHRAGRSWARGVRTGRTRGPLDQKLMLRPATGPLNSCFRPTMPSLPFWSTSSLNQS